MSENDQRMRSTSGRNQKKKKNIKWWMLDQDYCCDSENAWMDDVQVLYHYHLHLKKRGGRNKWIYFLRFRKFQKSKFEPNTLSLVLFLCYTKKTQWWFILLVSIEGVWHELNKSKTYEIWGDHECKEEDIYQNIWQHLCDGTHSKCSQFIIIHD